MSTLTSAIRFAGGLVRLIVPEGLALGLLLALPMLIPLGRVERYIPLLAIAAVVAALAMGWRFRRGRLVYGVLLVAAAALVPLLPPAPEALAIGLVPLNLALLAALPERGTFSGAGLVMAVALLAQAALLAWLADVATVVPPGLRLPGLAPVSFFAVGSAAGLATMALLAARSEDAIRRGLFWATVAFVVAHSGTAATAVWPAAWPELAATAVLVIAAVEEAHRLAYHDALTGLPSRRALDERLQRLGGRFTIAMVDVDHFKRFNDRHGHDIGDQVLRMVAARLRDTPGGRAYRYGGEEFAVVFRGKTVDDVREPLESLRRRIGETPFVIRRSDRPKEKPKRSLFLWRPRQTLKVTVSLGAATRNGWRQPPEEVVKEADQALYRAKKKGRNRVVA